MKIILQALEVRGRTNRILALQTAMELEQTDNL